MFVFNNGKDQFGCFNLVIMGGYLMLMTSTFGFSSKSKYYPWLLKYGTSLEK
jgi:hypothetical protein